VLRWRLWLPLEIADLGYLKRVRLISAYQNFRAVPSLRNCFRGIVFEDARSFRLGAFGEFRGVASADRGSVTSEPIGKPGWGGGRLVRHQQIRREATDLVGG